MLLNATEYIAYGMGRHTCSMNSTMLRHSSTRVLEQISGNHILLNIYVYLDS
jgi:hypothetical protein